MDTSHDDALFGRWLRRRRKALDLTQKDLARRIGCSPATIRKLEADERRPSKQVAGAIARALGVADDEHDAFVRFARAGWADEPPEAAAADLERPWLDRGRNGRAAAAARPRAVVRDTHANATRFLAREAELSRLDAAQRAAVDGRGGVVLLAGEAGQGKTSLMTAFAARALDAHPHLLAVTGACNAYTGRGDAFAPFREILRQLTGEEPPATDIPEFDAALRSRLAASSPKVVSTLLEHGPHLLDTFVPASLLRVPNGEGAAPADPRPTVLDLGTAAAGTAALRAEAVAVLARITADAPLLLLLDDLQWADPSSLELLLQLAGVAVRQRLLVVGAFRPEGTDRAGGPATQALGRAVRELERQFGEPVLDLGRADARAFLEAWIDAEPNDLGPVFRDALWRQTGGQPLFTIELLRAMQARGDLVKDARGRWVEGPDLRWDALPGRVAGALGQRVAPLDDDAAGVLRVAAVEGEVFTAEVVAHVLGLQPMQVARVLSETLDRAHRLVAAVDVRRSAGGQRVSRYRFRHNLIQRYVLDQIGATERSYLHESVAEASVALLDGEADPLAVAYHLGEAQAAEAAAPYLRQAGDRARRAGALVEAIDAYRQAAEHWTEHDDVGRAGLLRDLGQCLFVVGDRDEAVRALEEARATFERLGDPASAAATRALIVNVEFDRRPEDRPALEAYQKTLAVLESTPETAETAEVAHVLALMASLYVDDDNERARSMAERSLAMAERLAAEDERALALVRLGDIIADTLPERRAGGRAMMEQGLELARRLNLMEVVTYAMACLANLHAGVGRLDEAASTWRELVALSEAHDLSVWRRVMPASVFSLAWRRGHWREAVEQMATLRAEARRHPINAGRLAQAHIDLGRAVEARALLAYWETDIPTELVIQFRALWERAQLRAAAGLGEAERADRAAWGFLRAAGARPTYTHTLMATALDTVRWLTTRKGPEARQGVADALHILETTARQWDSPEAHATLASARGVIAWRDDPASAARPFSEAAGVWARAGYPLDEARAHSAAAQALRAAGEGAASAASLARASELLEGLADQLPQGELATSFASERRRLLAMPLALP